MKLQKRTVSVFIVASLLAISCEDNFLDRQIDSSLTKDRVFVSYDYVSQFLVGTYAWLPQGFNRIDDAMLASASDDAEHTWEGSEIQRFNLGSWGVHSNPDNQWSYFYAGIRRVNLLLENIGQVDLKTYGLNPLPDMQLEYQQRLADLERWKYEARFLRAYFYFELLKRYGPVPLITSTLGLNDDFRKFQRNSISECVDFIVSECDAAASNLNVYPGRAANDNNAIGRATKGSALALKSRVLLYAASPLYQAPDDLSDSKPSSPEMWQRAADAAKAVIDLGVYNLEANYSNAFNNFKSKELIIAYRYGNTNTFERANYSVGYEQGKSGTTPSQNLVNAYEMVNGKPIDDPESGYDPQDPYTGRDSRLLKSIVVNNSQWNGRKVELWQGGRDGKGKDQASRTGYYLKKYVVENLDLFQNRTQAHTWVLFRLAEIYLNYAEALNEYSPGDPDIARYVNLIRNRSAMPNLPDGLTQDEMRQRIHNERRVELAFEEHRFWDVRRWKTAPTVLGAPLTGMNVTLRDDQTFMYEEALVENRVFAPRMYWYPIPLGEIIKTDWSQNPQW